MSNYHGNSPNSWPSSMSNSPFFSFPPVNMSNLNQFGPLLMPSPFMLSMNSQFRQTLPNGSPFAPLPPITAPLSPTTKTNVIPRPTDSPTLTALPPCPPNWQEHYQNTVASLRSYQLFPVDPNTYEYAAIASLLDPALISTVEQIVNPTLWSRFVNARKDMLKSKCNDLELLSKLELSETELLSSYQHSLNFETDKKVLAVPYNDNMALLFHCTRDLSYIDSILRQGLDERIGSTQGLLGKGIYFADNPEKSMSYDGCGGIIFVFAVLLGDCLALDGRTRTQFVREPEKLPEQRRTFNEFFFDSIVGQPGAGLDNEYVIYNRYQCCPLYMIRYSPGSYTARANPNSDAYVTSRKYFPPIGWTSSANYYVTPARVQKTWPFYAKSIFATMGALVETTEEHMDGNVVLNDTMVGSVQAAVDKKAALDEKKKKKVVPKLPSGLSLKLQRLSEMGFHDRDENIEILRKHNFKLDKCVSYLLNSK